MQTRAAFLLISVVLNALVFTACKKQNYANDICKSRHWAYEDSGAIPGITHVNMDTVFALYYNDKKSISVFTDVLELTGSTKDIAYFTNKHDVKYGHWSSVLYYYISKDSVVYEHFVEVYGDTAYKTVLQSHQ